jgi:NADH-quinone oxidoreductase subunit H
VVVLAVNQAGPGVTSALKVAADVTQAVVAVGAFAAFVALIAGLLEPTDHKKFLSSTSARFAQAAGGTKATPREA